MRNIPLSRLGVLAFGLLIALLVSPAYALAYAIDEEKVRVDTPLGPVVGLTSEGVSVFLGLPFAAPPVGENRFAPPKDVEPWTEPREAFTPGPMALQVPLASFEKSVAPDQASPGYSEDCLYLNIWTPAGAKAGDGLPVYVFIHGGGYGLGSGSQYMYNGKALSKEGVVVVTVNYRLGAMGFFSSRETLKKFGTTGNWGLLDQIKALEWVRDNIKAFGGDPEKVTIGGESAGSFSASALILSPLATGLFRGVIMESGSILVLDAAFPFTRGELDLAIGVGSLLSSVFEASDDAPGLANLQKADAGLLTRLTPFGFDFSEPSYFGLTPVKDGRVLPKDLLKSLTNGDGQKVKILMGFNRDEGTLFIPDSDGDPEVYEDVVVNFLGANVAESVWKRFPVDKDNSLVDRVRQIIGYAFISANMKRFADLHARHADVFFYRFDYVTKVSEKKGLGANHMAELPFVFGIRIPDINMTEEEGKLGDDIRLRWVNFIKTGDPNSGTTATTGVKWPKYDPADPKVIIFDREIASGPLPDRENLDFMAETIFGPLN
jgi:para-nitrobenzyl esterase